ncbi:MAG: roadblock/LC7 domain-containing protein [Candidatus Heimdallarchaeaceae archaeon]
MSIKIQINSELRDLLDLEDVEGVVLFRIDGSVIESAFDDNYTQKILRVLQWCVGNVDKVSVEMKGNNLQKVTYELADSCVLFFAVDRTSILTTLAKRTANLSLLSIEAKRKASLISSYL